MNIHSAGTVGTNKILHFVKPIDRPLPFDLYKAAIGNLAPFGVSGVGTSRVDGLKALHVLTESKDAKRFITRLLRPVISGYPVDIEVVGKIVAQGARDEADEMAGRLIDARKTLKRYGAAIRVIHPAVDELEVVSVPVGEMTPAFEDAIKISVGTTTAKRLLDHMLSNPLEGVKLFIDDGKHW